MGEKRGKCDFWDLCYTLSHPKESLRDNLPLFGMTEGEYRTARSLYSIKNGSMKHCSIIMYSCTCGEGEGPSVGQYFPHLGIRPPALTAARGDLRYDSVE